MKKNKLYRYRPLSDFLFKELLYNELYFASYEELNDPLDLSARIDFNPEKEEYLEYLVQFLTKNSAFPPYEERDIPENTVNSKELIKFWKNEILVKEFCTKLHAKLGTKIKNGFISFDAIKEDVINVGEEFKIEFNFDWVKKELDRLTKVFFENSYTTCFSGNYSDFLMWSHYASKHSGICLEFTLHHSSQFPYIMTRNRKPDEKKYQERMSNWDVEEVLYWERIHKVAYQDTPPTINFYEFSPMFDNEGDCDLMNFSKSRWHGFAFELERVFSTKTSQWKYEKEWRAIKVNIGKSESPEERIEHYPIEALSGVYFGIRTPEEVKERVYKILNDKNAEVTYYQAHLTNGRDLEFEEWEYYEE